MQQPTQPIDWIRAAYGKRREHNPSYSLRAFSRDVRLPSGRVSEIMSGRRSLTPAIAEKMADRLGMLPEERQAFLDQVRGKVSLSRQVRRAGATKAPAEASWHALSEDSFYVVADWEHWAILSLMRTEGFREEPKWIGRRLGISVVQVRAALERLERVGLVTREGGKLRRPEKPVTTTHDVPSSALRRSHKQTLEQAIEAIEDYDVHQRDITSMSIVTDPSRIPLAKELIRDFRRKLAAVLEDGVPRTEVFNLNIQFVPLTKPQGAPK